MAITRVSGSLAFIGVLALSLTCVTSAALETDLQSGGPETVNTGVLNPPPTAPTVTSGYCSGGSQNTNVKLTWSDSQSATLDAAGGYLVSGYTISRATAQAGTYTALSPTISGSPPARSGTDTNPTGATSPVALVVNTGGGAYPLPENTLTLGTKVTINTAGNQPNAIQVTPDGLTAVIAESGTGRVQILTLSGGVWSVAATFTVTEPTAVAIDPLQVAGKWVAYVVSDAGAGANGKLYPVTLNGASSTLGTVIAIAHQATPTALVVLPSGTFAYVANYGSHTVSAVNLGTSAVTSIALTGTNPTPIALAATSDSSHVYVADSTNSTIDDITTSSNTVTASVALPSGALTNGTGQLTNAGDPGTIALTPNGQELYVAEYGSNQVQEVNTALAPTNPDTIATSISLGAGSGPTNLTISPNGCLVYVSTWGDNDVHVITTSTNTEAVALTLGCNTMDPQPMMVTPDNDYLYIPETAVCDEIQVVNTQTNAATTITGAGATTMVGIPPQTYWYEVTATHLNWSSNYSSPTSYTIGFNPGGNQ